MFDQQSKTLHQSNKSNESVSSNVDICVQPKIRFLADLKLPEYHLKEGDQNKTVNDVIEDIRHSNSDIKDSDKIIEEPNSYDDLSSDCLPIRKQENTISDLKAKSQNEKEIFINFIRNMDELLDLVRKHDEEIKKIKEIHNSDIIQIKEIDKSDTNKLTEIHKSDTNKLTERLEIIEKKSYNKILLRQLRNEMREAIFDEISIKKLDKENNFVINKNDYEKNCYFVSINIEKLSKKLSGWTKQDLDLLFNYPSYNKELNYAAHPNLTYNQKDLYEACQLSKTENLKNLHLKYFIKIFPNNPYTSSANQANTSANINMKNLTQQ